MYNRLFTCLLISVVSPEFAPAADSHRNVGVHPLNAPAAGAVPESAVIRDAAGNLYGTTTLGGAADLGTVYQLDIAGREKVIHSFAGGPDGYDPNAGLIRDTAGNFYGTTYAGGATDSGTVYKIDISGRETVLYSFMGGSDGSRPIAGVVRDSQGNLYGTAGSGGQFGYGIVYKLDTLGQETILHTFSGPDGSGPVAGVIREASGVLYGTTEYGGSANLGTVYRIDPSGQETVLHSFTGADGTYPFGAVVRDSEGNLYGTTSGGGSANGGTVYKIDPFGQETVLYSFQGGIDGCQPYAGVIRDRAGNLYGTTLFCGASGEGTVFKIDSQGQETLLHTFTGPDGIDPYAGLIRDANGNFYGTTGRGGHGYGTVYKIDTLGQETVLYSFAFN